jgi:TatD DNase family protein
MRGKKNEPSYIQYTAEFIAKARGMSLEAFAELTYANAERAFS